MDSSLPSTCLRMFLSPYMFRPSTSGYSHAIVLAALSLALFGYLATLTMYRLYLSPLASFPGPKMTALTQWYETYCEIFKKGGGQFVFEIHKWHEKYGVSTKEGKSGICANYV